MGHRRLPSLVALACTLLATRTAPAQQTTPAMRTPWPCGGPEVHDTTAAVYRSIWAQYGQIAQAMYEEDIHRLERVYSPQLVVKMPHGETWDYARSLAYSRAGFAQVERTILAASTILRLRDCGDTATATVLQQWTRIQRVAGRPRRVQTAAVQDETWLRTPGGWQRLLIEEIESGVTLIDDQRLRPGTPYDPEAPSYDPYAAHPKRPVADTLYGLIARTGVRDALRAYPALLRRPDLYTSEASLNGLGYRLLGEGQLQAAIAVFELNVRSYPRSSNVYDSLGEAYLKAGDTARAVVNYRRSLALDPGNSGAAEVLRRAGR